VGEPREGTGVPGTTRVQLGPAGIWSQALRYDEPGEIAETAAELEEHTRIVRETVGPSPLDDLADEGSDRLIDSLYAWGSLDRVAERRREHRQAGADHISVRVVGDREGMPIGQRRELATALV
jgi:hypothetical protein